MLAKLENRAHLAIFNRDETPISLPPEGEIDTVRISHKPMFNVSFLSRRVRRDSAEAREQRQKRFVLLAIFIGLVLAALFGAVLYSINVTGRI